MNSVKDVILQLTKLSLGLDIWGVSIGCAIWTDQKRWRQRDSNLDSLTARQVALPTALYPHAEIVF